MVLKHTFGAGDEITLSNTGATGISFYLSAAGSDGPGKTTVTVDAGQTQTVSITALGDLTNTYLHVRNVDTLAEGSFKVEL